MTRLFKTLAAGSMAALAFSAAVPALALDDQQKKEMGEFIREYLTQNPEVLIEAQNALEAKQQAQRVAQSTQAIEGNKKEIFSSPADITLGNPKGDVTIVEFFDYNCGYCKRALQDMEALVESNPDLRFVLKEFPILGPDSQRAHVVSMAFHNLWPENYGAFHRDLLAGEARVTEDEAILAAVSHGADEAALRQEMQNPDIIAAFQATYALAEQLSITGTPSYVVGDEVVFGAMGQEVLAEKIEQVRAENPS